MKEGNNNTVLLTVIGIATLLVAVVGATFAYFSAQLSGTENQSTMMGASYKGQFIFSAVGMGAGNQLTGTFNLG